MSLLFLFPLGLAALAAWALPLLLHLARREQRTPTDFAALRWLAIRAKPRARIRFDERLLLAVRLALLAAIALLLARPALTGGDDAGAWEVVHPALDVPPVAGDDAVECRWLADGFPPLDAPRPAPAVATASLLRQLDAALPAGAVLAVRVPATLDGLDGERPRLSRTVRWEVAAAPAAGDAPGATSATSAPRPRLAIRTDDPQADAARWLRAVAVAWRGEAPDGTASPEVAALAAAPPAGTDVVLAWLGAGDVPDTVRAWTEAGGTLLLTPDATWPGDAPAAAGDRDADAAPLGAGRVVRLRRPLRPDAWPALLEPSFPSTLRDLVATPPVAPARADAAAIAPVDGGAAYAPVPREFPLALAWAVIALFALERVLATGRRPGRDA